VSQDVHTAHNFGNETNLGATLSDVDAAAYTPSPIRDIHLEDLLDNFDETHQVSIQRLSSAASIGLL
jgi:hypothetical protein